MSFADDCRDLPKAPPSGSWQEHEPPTEPDATAPGLDLVLLAGVRRAVVSAERLAAAGLHTEATDDARRALELLTLAIGVHERRALVERLVRDARAAECAEVTR